MTCKNDKIGAWSLYGTMIIFVFIGIIIEIFITITDTGIYFFLVDTFFLLLNVILHVGVVLIILYIIQLFPEKWVPFLQGALFLSLIYYVDRSISFTILTGFVLIAYSLVNKKVENERLSKALHIALIIVFLYTLSEVD